MAIGFKYTLGVNETASLTELNNFIDKVKDVNVTVTVDFDLSSQEEAINKLKTQLQELGKKMVIPVQFAPQEAPSSGGGSGGSSKSNKKDLQTQINLTQRRLELQKKSITVSRQYREAEESVKKSIDATLDSMELQTGSAKKLRDSYADLSLTTRELKAKLREDDINKNGYAFQNLAENVKNLISQYMGLQAVLNGVRTAFQNGFAYIKELDDAYTDVAISMDISREQFEAWTETASQIAHANGQTTTSLMDMVKIYAQAGQSIEDIQAKLAGTAAIQNITGWDAEETTAVVTSIINQFDLAGEATSKFGTDSAAAINYFGDALIKMSNNLSMDNVAAIREMASAIDDAGAVIKDTGGSMEWFMALTGKIAEATNMSGSEIGGAMRMIAARTLRQGDMVSELEAQGEDLEITMAKAEKALLGIGVSIRGETMDELRGLEEILGDVAAKWDTLSDSQRRAVGEALAGTQRSSTFTAIMENYQGILDLQQQGLNANGELMEANQKRVESLDGQMNILKDTVNQLYSSFMSSEGLINAIKLATELLNSFTSLEAFMSSALFPAFATLGAVLSVKAYYGFASFIGEIINAFGTLTGVIQGTTAATIGLKMALVGIGVGIVTGAIALIVNHFSEMNERMEQTDVTAQNLRNSLANIDSNEDLINKYEQLNKKLEKGNMTAERQRDLEQEIAEIKQQLISADQGYADILSNQTDEYEKQVEAMKTISSLKERDEVKAALDEMDGWGAQRKMQKQSDRFSSMIAEIQSIDEQIAQSEARKDEVVDALATETSEAKKEALQEELDTINQALGFMDSRKKDLMSEAIDARQDVLGWNEVLDAAEKTHVATSLTQIALNEGASQFLDNILAAEAALAQTEDNVDSLGGETTETSTDGSALQEDVNVMQELNKQYVEQINLLKEAKQLVADLQDGMSLDDMNSLIDSDLMKDYVGSITDAEAVQEHLNRKIEEMGKVANQTYTEMLAADGTYWTSKISNADRWQQAELQAIANSSQAVLDSMGIELGAFQALVVDKGILREIDVSNAKDANEAQAMAEAQTIQAILLATQQMVNDKNIARNIDLQNVAAFLNEQGVMEIKTINDLAAAWRQFYEKKAQAIANSVAQLNTLANAGNLAAKEIESTSFTTNAAYQAMSSGAGEVSQLANSILTATKEVEAMNLSNPFADFAVAFNEVGASAIGATDAVGGLADKLSDIGSGSGGKGGKGGSGSSAIEKVVEDMEDLVDIYYEVNRAYEECENALQLNRAKQDNATGMERVKLLKEEIHLLNEKTHAIKDQLRVMDTEAQDLRSTLSEKGFFFDDTGNITNYAAQLQYLTDQANSLSGEAKQAAIDSVKEVNEQVEKYTDLMTQQIDDATLEWEEMVTEIREAERQLAEMVTDSQKDVGSAIEHYLQKRYDAVKTELEKEKELYNEQYEQEEYEDNLKSEQRKLDEIQQQINNLARDTSLAGQLKLEQLKQQYEEQQQVINDMIKENQKEMTNDKFEDNLNGLDEELENLLSTENLVAMINQALTTGFVTIGDEAIELQGIMDTWMNETGDGLYALGDILRTELCDNLEVAKGLMADMGIIDTSMGNSKINTEALNAANLFNNSNNMLNTDGGTPGEATVTFNAPLLQVDGNVSSDVLPDLEAKIKQAQEEVIAQISKQLARR